MHTAPLNERIDFFRYRSAEIHLSQALRIATELRDSRDDYNLNGWKFSALWSAFHVAYGKPFKQQTDRSLKRGIRLPDDVVPDEFWERHQFTLTLRDKMFAHTDLSSLHDNEGNPINLLRAFIDERGVPNFGTSFTTPHGEGLETTIAMVAAVHEKVTYRADKIWKKWKKHIHCPVLTSWDLNVTLESDDVLIPAVPTAHFPNTLPEEYSIE